MDAQYLIKNLNDMMSKATDPNHKITLDIAKLLIKNCSKGGKLCLTKDQFDKEVR